MSKSSCHERGTANSLLKSRIQITYVRHGVSTSYFDTALAKVASLSLAAKPQRVAATLPVLQSSTASAAASRATAESTIVLDKSGNANIADCSTSPADSPESMGPDNSERFQGGEDDPSAAADEDSGLLSPQSDVDEQRLASRASPARNVKEASTERERLPDEWVDQSAVDSSNGVHVTGSASNGSRLQDREKTEFVTSEVSDLLLFLLLSSSLLSLLSLLLLLLLLCFFVLCCVVCLLCS